MKSPATFEGPRLCQHGRERMRQRGYREGDLELVFHAGTPMGNAVVLTDRDVSARIAEHRRCIAQLERLRGTALILEGDRVLSVYRPRRAKLRRFFRHRNGRGLGVPRARDAGGRSEPEKALCA